MRRLISILLVAAVMLMVAAASAFAQNDQYQYQEAPAVTGQYQDQYAQTPTGGSVSVLGATSAQPETVSVIGGNATSGSVGGGSSVQATSTSEFDCITGPGGTCEGEPAGPVPEEDPVEFTLENILKLPKAIFRDFCRSTFPDAEFCGGG